LSCLLSHIFRFKLVLSINAAAIPTESGITTEVAENTQWIEFFDRVSLLRSLGVLRYRLLLFADSA